MIHGVIDLGSNTIRLTVYRVKGKKFNTLFSQKTMAGLVGYVKDGVMSMQGMDKACEVLDSYRSVFKNLDFENLAVFATASLRNIQNSQEVVDRIQEKTGLLVEIISGEEEARLDFEGATHNVDMTQGILVDIGGGSMELVTYNDAEIITPVSVPVGSLSLYNGYVKKILPKDSECKEMRKLAETVLSGVKGIEKKKYPILCGVGGTIRAALKINNFLFSSPTNNNEITSEHLSYIYNTLTESNKTAMSIILKICPDRIHTIIPGLCLLKTVMERYKCEKIEVSNFGVREGYLYSRIIQPKADAPVSEKQKQ